jgi:CIC family chloride channel protein
VKSVASVITVESGGSAGYEGPITLIGAACGSFLASVLHLDGRARRILMAAGLAAGISALFRAPLAGALFGAEIFYSSSDLEYDVILPSFVASAVSYTVFACFVGWQPLFAMPDYAFENGIRLFPYIALAFVVTLGARFYITFFRTTESFFTRMEHPAWVRVAIGGLVTGAAGFFLPDVMGPGYAVIQRTFAMPGATAVSQTVASHWPLHGFLLFFLLKTIATACTVGSGGSGGVFAPALVCGGALGAAVGLGFEAILPSSVGIHPAAFALVGMAGFVAAAVRCPLAAIVMVAEISGNHALLLPTMWVCGIAFWLNNGWSLYRSQVHDRGASPVYM